MHRYGRKQAAGALQAKDTRDGNGGCVFASDAELPPKKIVEVL